MELKKLGYAWFTGSSCICIAYKEDVYGKYAYIATVNGFDEESDLKRTLEYGSKFPIEEAESVINKFGTWKNLKK